MIVQKTQTRKNEKAISGAITALILVIASVIIALVVVFFAFGYVGQFTGKTTVTQLGYGTFDGKTLSLTLVSTGDVKIIAVQYGAASVPVNYQLTAGTNVVNLDVTGLNLQSLQGQTYQFTLLLSNGNTVIVSAIGK